MTIFGDTLKAHPHLAWAVGMTVAQPDGADSEPETAPEPQQAQEAPEGGERS